MLSFKINQRDYLWCCAPIDAFITDKILRDHGSFFPIHGVIFEVISAGDFAPAHPTGMFRD